MKISRDEKHRNAMEILNLIHDCKTEADLEKVNDIAEGFMLSGRIYKKDYKFLGDEMDDQLSYLIQEGLI